MSATGYDLPAQPAPGVRAWAQLTLSEMRSVVRDTSGLIVPIGMPSLFLLVQGFASSSEVVPGTGGRSVLELFVLPLMLVMVVALVGVVNMPSFLATYRKGGLLKRLAATPARPPMVLGAQVITSLAQTAVGVALAVGLAWGAFGLVGPERPWLAVARFAAICASLYGCGLVVAAIAPTPNASVAIGLVVFFALGAVGGLFGGLQSLPDPIAAIGEWTPFGAGVVALQCAWVGEPVPAQSVIALVVTAVVGAAFAIRFFRWDR